VRLELPGAWLAAAIFAVHPVQAESVAWITERKNVLCGLFYFAAMLVYFNSRGERPRLPGRGTYAAALALFTCAMFSKTVACTWPAAVLVIIWWKSGKVRMRDIWPLIPFFVIGVLLASLTSQLEAEQVGAVGKDWDLTLSDRCIVAGRAIWFYAGKAVFPMRLTFVYPKWDLQDDRALQAVIAAAASLLLPRS
jgi:protein O-mannosyl-transferase